MTAEVEEGRVPTWGFLVSMSNVEIKAAANRSVRYKLKAQPQHDSEKANLERNMHFRTNGWKRGCVSLS